MVLGAVLHVAPVSPAGEGSGLDEAGVIRSGATGIALPGQDIGRQCQQRQEGQAGCDDDRWKLLQLHHVVTP